MTPRNAVEVIFKVSHIDIYQEPMHHPQDRSDRLILTSQREDARRRLAVGWHRRRWYPEWRGRLVDGRRHGQAAGGYHGRRRERDDVGKIDVIYDERVVAVVKRAQVAADAKSFFCMGEEKIMSENSWLPSIYNNLQIK